MNKPKTVSIGCLTDKTINECIDLYNKGWSKLDVRKFIQRNSGYKETRAREIANELYIKCLNTQNKTPEQITPKKDNKDLYYTEKYVYNPESKLYVFLTEGKLGKNVKLQDYEVKSIIKTYSNYDGDESSINEVCLKFNITRQALIEVLKSLNFTHDTLPFLPEELLHIDEDKAVDELIQDKRFIIHQKLQKKDWNQTKEDAAKWNSLISGVINPIQEFLSSWEPKSSYLTPLSINRSNSNEQYEMVVGLSDVHFGAYLRNSDVYNHKEWSTEKTKELISEYAKNIKSDVSKRNYSIKKLNIVSVGDIIHTLSGLTNKGTVLEYDHKGIDQFKFAFEAICQFIESLGDTFEYINVYSVGGNHDFVGDWMLFNTLEKYFRNENRITFYNSATRWIDFKIVNSLFIAEHGYSHQYKSKVPASGPAREAYIQNLFIKHSNKHQNINSRYFICGDQHSLQYDEYNNFEMVRFSSSVGGDKYPDHCNLHSRQRQNAFIVDSKGIKEIINYYFDV